MENKKSKTIRIKDIAKMSGVSEGTVDRVLHKRGDVSEKSFLAVKKVLEEINYTPNLLARSLASKKQYRFDCVFPAFEPGEYWESVSKGFDEASKNFKHHNITIYRHLYDQFDELSYENCCKDILKATPDAVFIAPIFMDVTLKFIAELQKNGIQYSLIDSIVPNINFLTYYGQDSFKSGYVASKLLLESLPTDSSVLVVRNRKKGGTVSNQTILRYRGFMHYIEEHKLSASYKLVEVDLDSNDHEFNSKILKLTFSKNPQIKAAITFNSRVFRLAEHLEELEHTDVRLIGYDLLEKNISYLKRDVVSYLIAQRPEKQAFLSVRDMCHKLIFKQNVSHINYVPVDILIKENIDDYLFFSDSLIE